ncbi:MAG: alkaline phosphatase [Bacteroidales bacterium]|nr:alkaline phosphatase [Bacteroidales bacterium]
MIRRTLLTIAVLFYFVSVNIAQVAIGTLDDPDASAILDIVSTDKGVLFPRMTTVQRKTIDNPANGLCVYDTDESCLFTYNAKEKGWKGVGLKPDEGNNGSGQKVKNVILMVASGMGMVQLQAGFTKNNDYLEMTAFPYAGFMKTHSAESKTTDSAAAASALSTGVKTKNGCIGIDASGFLMPTIMEIAKEKGLSTGFVVTSSVTHPTPAAFYAHQPDTSLHRNIGWNLITSGIDVCIGGGRDYFDVDMMNGLNNKGYQVFSSLDGITPEMDKVIALAASRHLPKMSEGRGRFFIGSYRKSTGYTQKE